MVIWTARFVRSFGVGCSGVLSNCSLYFKISCSYSGCPSFLLRTTTILLVFRSRQHKTIYYLDLFCYGLHPPLFLATISGPVCGELIRLFVIHDFPPCHLLTALTCNNKYTSCTARLKQHKIELLVSWHLPPLATSTFQSRLWKIVDY